MLAAERRRRARVTATSDSPPGGANDGSARQRVPLVGREVAEAALVPLAVVELDEPIVDVDREAVRGRDRHARSRRARCNGLATTRVDRFASRARRASRAACAAPSVGQRGVDAALQPAVAVGRGLAVPDERDHRSVPSIHRRSQPAACAGTPRAGPGRRARTASRSTTRPRARAVSSASSSGQRREQRRVRAFDAERRPPEHFLVRPRAAEHEAREPADRRSSSARRRRRRWPRPIVASIATTSTHDRRPAACARTTVRRTARRSRAGAARRARSGGSRGPELWNTFHTPKIEPHASQRIIGARGVERGVHQRVGFDVLLARHVLEVDLVVACAATRLRVAYSGAGAAGAPGTRPASWSDHEQRVGADADDARVHGARRPRARRSAPGTRRRCSSSTPMRLAHGREPRRADRSTGRARPRRSPPDRDCRATRRRSR